MSDTNKAKFNLTKKYIPFGDDRIVQVAAYKGDYGCNYRISGDPTNCKLSYIHGIGMLSNYGQEYWTDIINTLLDECKGTVLINTTNPIIGKFLKENFEHYYYHEVPIGYNDKFQYHILIRNLIRPNHNCRTPIKPFEFNKSNLKDKLKLVLRKLRRKDDYVDSFVDNL